MEKESLLEVLERRQKNRKLKEERDAFFKYIRGEKSPPLLIKRIRGE